MKGLALIMSAAKKGPAASEEATEPAADDEAAEGEDAGGSEMEFARIAADALSSGDKEAGAEALVKMVKACMSSYGGEKG